jgi:hypothetical protein
VPRVLPSSSATREPDFFITIKPASGEPIQYPTHNSGACTYRILYHIGNYCTFMRRRLHKTTEYVHDSTLFCVPYRLRRTLFNEFRACYREFSGFIKEVGHMPISKPNSPNSFVWVNVFFAWRDAFLCMDSTLFYVPYRLRCTIFNDFRAFYGEFSGLIKEVGHMPISKPNSPNSLVWVNVFFT